MAIMDLIALVAALWLAASAIGLVVVAAVYQAERRTGRRDQQPAFVTASEAQRLPSTAA